MFINQNGETKYLSSNGAMQNFSLRPITSNIETASYHQLANYYLQLLTE